MGLLVGTKQETRTIAERLGKLHICSSNGAFARGVMTTNPEARPAAARAFVRSLNILLKFARMYDFGHPRTAKQYETAWTELQAALGPDNEAGLLLAVSGDQLLLDGTPLESAAAEKSFARMLSASGIASIHFSPKVTQASLTRFVRGFPTGSGTKPNQLAEQLKTALQGDPNIHVNEVCFVPADSAVAKSTVAAQLAARTLGLSAGQSDELFNDPEKLLQLIVAAEGTRGSPGGPGGNSSGGDGSGTDGPGTGGGYGPPGNGLGDKTPGGSEWGVGGSGWGGGRSSGTYSAGGIQPGEMAAGSDAGVAGFYKVGPPTDSSGNANGDSSANAESNGLVVEGPAISAGGTNPSLGGGTGTWNIVGGGAAGGRTSLDPNSGGFWLNKSGSGGPQTSPLGNTPAGQEGEGIVLNGPASGTGGEGSDSSGGGIVIGAAGSGSGGVGASSQGFSGGAGSALGNGLGIGTGSPGPGGPNLPAGAGGRESGGPNRWANATAGMRSTRPARAGAGSMAVETGLMTLREDELQGILQVLAQIARMGEGSKGKLDPSSFQSRLTTLPRRARFTVSQALAALAAQAPSDSTDKPTLLKLAEHIAVRFALESYERGDIEVNAVRQLLDEMSLELDGLRKILGSYEEKMRRAGLDVRSHVDLLAQQFWAQIPEAKTKAVLESTEAWCVPPAKVREYVDSLISKGETEQAENVLRNYAACVSNKNVEPRRQTALGLAELAPIYTKGDHRIVTDTIRRVGIQLAEERDSELQSLVGAAFVRLSQEAAKSRSYSGVQRAVELMDYVESERPGVGKNLRPRVAVESRLPEFIEEAIRTGDVPGGLQDLLRRLPIPAAESIAGRFSRAGFREDCDVLVSMMKALGPEGLQYLHERLRQGSSNEAIDAVGILARVDSETLQEVLPQRIGAWKRPAHDRIVRQIALSGAPNRAQLLLQLFDFLDALIRPLAVDEIGMSGEQLADMRLLRIAEGDLPKDGTEYLRLKAIEALGRLRTPAAEAVLRKVVEGRRTWRWANPPELRLVALQAMAKIDPEWVRSFIPTSGLSVAEFTIEPLDCDPNSSATRQRRYPRLRLDRPMPATTTNLKENCDVEIPELTLGGGVAICEQSLHPGNVVGLRLNPSQKPVKAQTIVRDANTQARAFEIVEIELDERSKLRKLLVQFGNAVKQSSPQERSRRGTRAILATPA